MFTYAGPGNGLKDQVRFLVGDTRIKDPYLQDEEILFLLKQHDNDVDGAAITACHAIMAHLARSRDETVGSVSIAFSQALAGYTQKLAMLKMQLVLNGGIRAFAGGISHQEKATAERNPDWERPDFSHDMMRSPWVAPFLNATPSVAWEQYPW